MVTGIKPIQTIEYFEVIKIGETMACTKTGKHYIKTSFTSWKEVGLYNNQEIYIDPKTLVYRNPYDEHVMY